MRATFTSARPYQAILLAASLLLASAASAGTTYKVLHNFGPPGGSDGSQPNGPPLLDAKGNLYGVTFNGGSPSACGGVGCGIVFELTPRANGKWNEHTLYAFTGTGNHYSAFPQGNLVQDALGNLYGFVESYYGSYGDVFELFQGSTGWNLDLIWTQGAGPGLLLDAAGDLYGLFCNDSTCGIAELSGQNRWTYALLTDQTSSASPLSWDTKGNLYGTSAGGGKGPCSGGCGYAWELTPNGDGTWTYHVIHYFGSWKNDGQGPYGGLVLDAAGNAYGGTWGGGPYNCGIMYKLSPSGGHWKETVLYNFPSGWGSGGCAMVDTPARDSAGNLYGMTLGGDKSCGPCGSIFKLSPQKSGKWKYSALHIFHGPEGAGPYGVILDSKGHIFGTTVQGGKYGFGVAFEISPQSLPVVEPGPITTKPGRDPGKESVEGKENARLTGGQMPLTGLSTSVRFSFAFLRDDE
jgi:hypothetical protein